MYVLGISCYYHDSSAALIKDGKIVAAAQEERFTRVKHDTSFPNNAIQWCLKSQNITIDSIDYIGFYEKPLLKFWRVMYQHLNEFPKTYKTFISSTPSWILEKLRVVKKVRKELKYKKGIMFVDHHMAHAASFLVSPYEKAAIVNIDGVGEWSTTTVGVGSGINIKLVKEIRFPHSLGLLYSAITAYLGFSVNNSEYKVMGLAPYGDMNRSTNKYYLALRNVIDYGADGSFSLDMKYFKYHYADRMPSEALCTLLGGPIRKAKDALDQRHKNIAAAVQLIYEDALFEILNSWQKESGEEKIVLSGGCGLNSVANGKILKQTSFNRVWSQPDPGDGGTSIGVAAYIYHTLLGNLRTNKLDDAFLGPEYTNEEIEDFLKKNNIKYERFNSFGDLILTTARLITQDNVIGWFQGKMEWGPRALGSRSILSNACNPKMQEILNTKVKHREKFRPFAPVVCEDDADTYFEIDKPLPLITDFMLMVYPIRPKYRSMIPAVTHVDGSGRLQSISERQNPKYYHVIKAVGAITGTPILINTSFNIRGEPIVCSPYDAYKCMMGTGIDYLVIGDFIIKRADNLQHAWDSEKYATD